MCNCGFNNTIGSKYCSNCGLKINVKNKISTFPKILTVKEAHETIFDKKISLTKIYDLIRSKSLPHCNANGKILLDLEKTKEWWNNKLNESTKPIKLSGLRKII